MIKNVTLGADPEVFLQNELELISAEGLIGGTKEEPRDVPGYPGFYIQEDNVMVEFNIPPADNQQDFLYSIETMKDYIEMSSVVHQCEISKLASGEFNERYLETEQAARFGCEPDMNVYTRRKNKVEVPNGSLLRTCGGHIHVGYDNPTNKTSAELVFAMDITLGLNSLSLDGDSRRRELYGNAGSFRFKDYGVEYRTLSNFWIFNRENIRWAWNGTMAAIELVNSGLIEKIKEQYGTTVQACIDKDNKKLAKKLMLEISNFIKKETICAESLDTQGVILKK